MIDVDGQRIRVSVSGDGPPLLLIIGIGGQHRNVGGPSGLRLA